jgi:GxxExxY protein
MTILTESDPRTYAIIGAAMEVHQQPGCGFLEPVYQEALAIELANRTIPFQREQKFPINYQGCALETHYRPDFICFEAVIVELKALGRLSSIEESQVINYLKVTGYHIGLLLNFGNRSLEKRRFVLS